MKSGISATNQYTSMWRSKPTIYHLSKSNHYRSYLTMLEDKINDYINTHPKQMLQLCIIGVCLLWQSVVAILGLILYLILVKYLRLKWWQLLITGIAIATISIFFEQFYFDARIDLIKFIQYGFYLNRVFWAHLFKSNVLDAFLFLGENGLNYIIGLPLLLTGILGTIDLINSNPFEKALKSLQKGITHEDIHELPKATINKALKKINEKDFDCTVIGVSKYTGANVVIPDSHINSVLLLFGTTGSGKTITIRRFYERAARKKYPQIYVDGKPDNKNIQWLMQVAEKNGVPFYGFNCGNYYHYDAFAHGSFTELKDKVICLKDEWSNEYYQSIAEDYLQTTFEILLQTKRSFDLKKLVNYLNHKHLLLLAREVGDTYLVNRVKSLEHYDLKDIAGLRAHLNILAHSELGQYFEVHENTFSLTQVIKENAIAYFALPALSFPSFSKVLGKLVINDIKGVINSRNGDTKKIFTIFDEFSVFAGEQVLNLVNMGRGKGVHAIFGTQGVADLEKNDPAFKKQIMNCANTIICHRLNDKDSVEEIANWAGTKDTFTVTAQLNTKESNAGLGSVKRDKEFIVHPDAIKQGLQTGEAFYITKVGRFRQDKVRIKYV